MCNVRNFFVINPDDTVQIHLLHGYKATLDFNSWLSACERRWHVRSSKGGAGVSVATVTHLGRGRRYATSLGKYISGYRRIAYVNRDLLDNRLSNLVDFAARPRKEMGKINRTSKYKGIGFVKSTGRWQARIYVDGKKIYLGHYMTEERALAAYQRYINRAEQVANKLNEGDLDGK